MIKINNRQVIDVPNVKGKKIIEVWTHNEMVWPDNGEIPEKISCFAKGFWINDYPWTNHYAWRNI